MKSRLQSDGDEIIESKERIFLPNINNASVFLKNLKDIKKGSRNLKKALPLKFVHSGSIDSFAHNKSLKMDSSFRNPNHMTSPTSI